MQKKTTLTKYADQFKQQYYCKINTGWWCYSPVVKISGEKKIYSS